MKHVHAPRGGAPVGFITELDGVEAASVIYLRLWSDGPKGKHAVRQDFETSLGKMHGHKALTSFEDLYGLCALHGRRPLMRHAVNCKCVGADEACFANFIAAAATGQREDAMMIATLLVRPDFAPVITGLARDFGLTLMRMNVQAPRTMTSASKGQPGSGLQAQHPVTLH
ncbi:hypothetical protein [Ascidiaceihabitans sp.]|uniref:hypothetical protein n=1 Tax=Ascidiaceihabitans sp. TaxID=1872644 RepID=UPI003297C5DE